LFLIKWAGTHIESIIEALLHRERTAAVKYEQIKMQNTEILEKFEDMKKNMADDVTAKKRIILEKSETNNALWEKIKALEIKEEKLTS
ncbi:9876_t:CDS:2, partial [Rhizophagus irregularis]